MPSEKVLSEKKEIVSGLAEKLRTAVSGVLVDYRGISVGDDTLLRNKLREADVEYKVVKNTLLRFAANETGFDELDPILNDPTALALSFSDPIAPAKVLCEFAQKNSAIKIKAGFIDGKVVDAKEIDNLSKLPSKEVLIAKTLGGLNAPISGFVHVLNGNLRGLVCALSAIAEQKSA